MQDMSLSFYPPHTPATREVHRGFDVLDFEAFSASADLSGE